MKLLKKAKRKPTTVGQAAAAILLVDGLIKKNVLRTTAVGVFYTYPEILKIGPTPDNIAKNIYLYARACKLISKGQTLYFRKMVNDFVIGQYDVKHGFILI